MALSGTAPPNAPSRRVECLVHCRALISKNVILKRRQWSAQCLPWCPLAACCELLLPLTLLLLLMWAKTQCLENDGQCSQPVLAGWGGHMPLGSTQCAPGVPLEGNGSTTGFSVCYAYDDKLSKPLPFYEVLSYLYWSGKKLALAATDDADISKLSSMRDYISEHWHPDMWLVNIPCVNLEKPVFSLSDLKNGGHHSGQISCEENIGKVVDHPGVLPSFKSLTFPKIFTSKELESYLESETYGSEGFLWGAVVFDAVGGDGSLGAPGPWSYTIRLNNSAKASPNTRLPPTRPLVKTLHTSDSVAYLEKGFVSLQLLINRYIIGSRNSDANINSLLHANKISLTPFDGPIVKEKLAESLRYAPQAVEAVPFPVAGLVIDYFYILVAALFPVAFIVSFLYTQKTVINEFITEKETKVRESLRMMGVGSFAIISSWYVSYACLFAATCCVFSIVAILCIFPSSNVVLVFLFFWLWMLSFMGFAFFVQAFFNQARVGGIIGVLLMFSQWIAYASENKQDDPASGLTMTILMLLPNGALCAGLDMLAQFESTKVGVRWNNLFWPVENSNFATVLLMMCVDVVLWTALGWYLDRVLPKEFGVRLPVYFPFQPSYWFGHAPRREAGQPAARDLLRSEASAVCVLPDSVEHVGEAVRARSTGTGTLVVCEQLRREFSTPAGKKVAVDDLQLTMYEGEIFALLGHNGAGKSTTINMLTGMVTPSAGDATIAGHSILTDMTEIRRLIGVCPQHDVLWSELTVIEHLRTFALLRGVPARDVEKRAKEMMQEVGLAEKWMTRAGSLSGGQKRKLSLCLALISRPRVSFLDEPTSGMDPFSRRSTWNIIQGVREGRVTVLTTHFMDEADILGDRIAIMANGSLQCCGSSLFLKTRFGAGYLMTCARRQVFQHAPTEGDVMELEDNDNHGRNGKTPLGVIRKHVPEAEVVTDIGAELSVRLPTLAAPRFPNLFLELDRELPSLGMEHYGLSMVTLEEVFLRIASGEALESSEHLMDVRTGAEHNGSDSRSVDEAPVPEALSECLVMVRNFFALYVKRARYARRDVKAVVCNVLIPVVWLAFGLFVFDRISNGIFPPMQLDMQSQFGDYSPLPYHAEPSSRLATAMQHVTGVDLLFEEAPVNLDHGQFFGRNYTDGLPVIVPCDKETTIMSKCWREENICDWGLVRSLQGVGVRIGCLTDQAGCVAALVTPCANGRTQCLDMCMASGGTSRTACKTECSSICKQTAVLEGFCDTLQDPGSPNKSHTIGWLCPQHCAGVGNDTCALGTSCSMDTEQRSMDPKTTLSLEMLLFEQGQGLGHEGTRHGAVSGAEVKEVGTTLTLEYNCSAPHIVPALLNVVSDGLKKAVDGALGRAHGSDAAIQVASHPFPWARNGDIHRAVSAVVNIFSVFVIIEAFSFIPAALVAYIVREREAHHNSKHQQLISGVSITSYWVSNLVWDLGVYCVPSTLSLFIIWAYNMQAFVMNGALWAVAVTFVFYGVAIVPFSYLLSFLFSKHTTAQVVCLVANFVTGLLLVDLSSILSVIDKTKHANEILMWIFRLFPGFCLGHSLLQICENSLIANLFGGNTELNLLAWDVAGKDVLYLAVTGPVCFVLVILIDYTMHSPLAAYGKHLGPNVDDESHVTDEDVQAETSRVLSSGCTDVVRILALRKVYRTLGKPKYAVKDLSLGLPRGECFGFLGINGAGKTSTLNMLTGAILPSGGTAKLGGFDIVTEQWQVRRLLGYCPQHDALLDRLTVREHLQLFGRIKGTPRLELKRYCEAMMSNLDLTPHMDKLAMTLSGGNKRKLSLAISMMGSPPLIFLDEPSTGVDPAARRLMWKVIENVSTIRCQSCVMLTTHNMEEAEALASRVGIMVGGRLQCIGSNQHLKARFGSGYQLEVRLKSVASSRIDAAVDEWRLPARIVSEDMEGLCNRLGAGHRASWVCEGCEEGYVAHSTLERVGHVPARVFAEWWLLEDVASALNNFLRASFHGTEVVERHERTFRFRLPSTSSLAVVFERLERSRLDLGVEEYGISQTSLEQIFNEFASKQEEETTLVRGLQGQPESRATVAANGGLHGQPGSMAAIASDLQLGERV